jgi:Tol biopolymer transport system component
VLTARTLLYLARPSDQLWALDVTTTKTRRVSSGLERYTSLSASRDGRRIVSTLANPTATLWTVSLLDRMADDRDVQPYPMPTVRALAPRFGGTSLFYLSARGAGDGLWRLHDGQASEIWRGADGALSEPAAVSRDGRRIAVVLRRDGNARLTVMSADGTNARTVAPAIELQGAATQSMFDWSPDGRWIVTGGSDATGQGLMKILVDGDAVTRLASGQANNPIWSPDGTIIVYSGLLVGGQVPMLAMRPDGAPVDIGEARARPGGYRFLPNGTGLIYLPRIQGLDFWLLDFATRTTRQLTRLSDKGVIRNFDITPDGKHIVFDRSRDNSDVVLIDLPAN